MSGTVCVKFFKQFEYNELVFKAGEVYRLNKTKDDFVGRWIRRGCKEVEDCQEALPDPRFPVEEKKKVGRPPKKEKKVEEKKVEEKKVEEKKAEEKVEEKVEEKKVEKEANKSDIDKEKI